MRSSERPDKEAPLKVAIMCVGNKLMLDDGLGPVVYEELVRSYSFPDEVDLFDLGCMTLSMIESVNDYDYIIAIDAVEDSGEAPGTVFEFDPDDMMRHSGATASIHELTLADLFDSAALIGYECDGKCFGMQVQNMSPAEVTIGLTRAVYEAVPLLIDSVLADLYRHGIEVEVKSSGEIVKPGFHHTMTE